jgi:putative aldouronate transport system permease protein
MKTSFIRSSMSRRLFDVCNVIFMVLLVLVMLYPFYQQLVLSFNQGLDAQRGGLFFYPRKPTLESYAWLFKNSKLLSGAAVSVARVVVGTTTTLLCTAMLAFLVSLRNFSGRRFLRRLFLVTMYFGGGFIPVYLLFYKLKLINTFFVYWVPSLFDAYFMLLISSYIYNLPNALVEAAWIDGAPIYKIFFYVIIPICAPVLAAVAIFSAVSHWNAWFDNMIFNPSGKWDTIQMILMRMMLQAEIAKKIAVEAAKYTRYRTMTPETVKAAATIVITLPIVLVYPFFQKYFIGGITIGAVKE